MRHKMFLATVLVFGIGFCQCAIIVNDQPKIESTHKEIDELHEEKLDKRDVINEINERLQRRCDACKNQPTCKTHGKCNHCDLYCKKREGSTDQPTVVVGRSRSSSPPNRCEMCLHGVRCKKHNKCENCQKFCQEVNEIETASAKDDEEVRANTPKKANDMVEATERAHHETVRDVEHREDNAETPVGALGAPPSQRNEVLTPEHRGTAPGFPETNEIIEDRQEKDVQSAMDEEPNEEVPEEVVGSPHTSEFTDNRDDEHVESPREKNAALPEKAVRYYTAGAFKPGPKMNILARLLNIHKQEDIERMIVLTKTKSRSPQEDVGPPVIIDVSKLFENGKDSRILNFDGNVINGADIELTSMLDRELDMALRKKKEMLGEAFLTPQEIRKIIDHTMQMYYEMKDDEPKKENVGSAKETTTCTDEPATTIKPITNAVEKLVGAQKPALSSEESSEEANETNPKTVPTTETNAEVIKTETPAKTHQLVSDSQKKTSQGAREQAPQPGTKKAMIDKFTNTIEGDLTRGEHLSPADKEDIQDKVSKLIETTVESASDPNTERGSSVLKEVEKSLQNIEEIIDRRLQEEDLKAPVVGNAPGNEEAVEAVERGRVGAPAEDPELRSQSANPETTLEDDNEGLVGEPEMREDSDQVPANSEEDSRGLVGQPQTGDDDLHTGQVREGRPRPHLRTQEHNPAPDDETDRKQKEDSGETLGEPATSSDEPARTPDAEEFGPKGTKRREELMNEVVAEPADVEQAQTHETGEFKGGLPKTKGGRPEALDAEEEVEEPQNAMAQRSRQPIEFTPTDEHSELVEEENALGSEQLEEEQPSHDEAQSSKKKPVVYEGQRGVNYTGVILPSLSKINLYDNTNSTSSSTTTTTTTTATTTPTTARPDHTTTKTPLILPGNSNANPQRPKTSSLSDSSPATADEAPEPALGNPILEQRMPDQPLGAQMDWSFKSTRPPQAVRNMAGFGRFVPSVKDSSVIAHKEVPGVKNGFFLGADMNLPMQLKQHTDGSVKLDIDVDKLCNCRGKDACKDGKKEGKEMTAAEQDDYDYNFVKEDENMEGVGRSKRSPSVAYIERKNLIEDPDLKKASEEQDDKDYRYKGKYRNAFPKKVVNVTATEKRIGLMTDLLTWMKKLAVAAHLS